MQSIYFESIQSEIFPEGTYYEKFLISNLKLGQGITIGNQLRRMLLGELGGYAISAIRINNYEHEFYPISGVREDILEILLNLKGIIIRRKNNNSNISDISFESGQIAVRGPSVITGNDIKISNEFEIINPNHYIATISDSSTLEIELIIEYGTGYNLASQPFDENNPKLLGVDAIFTPVHKVDFKIENIYDRKENLSERLLLEIWTDGSVKPKEAIFKASKMSVKLFLAVMRAKKYEPIKKIESKLENGKNEPYQNITIEDLELSVRPYNCLKRTNINTVSELLKYSPEQLMDLKNFGRKSADEVISALKNKFGIDLNNLQS